MITKFFSKPLIIGIIILILALIIFALVFLQKKSASSNIEIVGDEVVRDITVQYNNDPYKTKATNEAAAREYLSESGIVPESYVDNAKVTRTVDDSKESINEFEKKLLTEHYFFQQYVGGLPVEGGVLAVHVKNSNEVYFVSGNAVVDTQVEEEKISMDEAVAIAVSKAQDEVGSEIEFDPPTAEKVIYNAKLFGMSNDNKNIPAAKVTVGSGDALVLFAKEYIVSLVDGTVLTERSLIYHALNRQIYDCNGTQSSCPSVRSEGSSPSGVSDADSVYNFFGDTYNLYFNNFQRDSYDGNGAVLSGFVHYPFSSPNAAWDSRSRRMMYGSGMTVNDVTGHELTHAVTSSTAGLIYQAQPGAINEGMSDVFGWAVDPSDWLMGEDSVLGPIRSLSNPPEGKQPDRIFAANYYCSAGDNYGVHRNSGILNKTFYLLVNGGSFNTCNVRSIGKDRALSIFYRALTRYLTSNSNYKDLYLTLMQSCNDLYANENGVCEQVDIASQATEIDQQPQGSQMSPVCSGASGQPPKCASNGQQPTVPPVNNPSSAPTTAPSAPTATPGSVRYFIQGKVFQDNNSNGIFEVGVDIGLVGQSLVLSGDLSTSTSTLADGTFIFDNLIPGTYNVSYQTSNIDNIQLGPTRPGVEIPFSVMRSPSNPTPTIIPGPTSIPSTPTPTPSSSGSRTTPTLSPTPTPVPYTCVPDPNCKSGRGNVQLCPLVCNPS